METYGIWLAEIIPNYNRDLNHGKIISICKVNKFFLIRTIGCGVHDCSGQSSAGCVFYLN